MNVKIIKLSYGEINVEDCMRINYAKIIKKLTENRGRREEIMRWICQYFDPNKKILIVSQFIENLEYIKEELRKISIISEIYLSNSNDEENYPNVILTTLQGMLMKNFGKFDVILLTTPFGSIENLTKHINIKYCNIIDFFDDQKIFKMFQKKHLLYYDENKIHIL